MVKQSSKKYRIASACPIAMRCGGCSQIDTPYTAQLAAKDAAMALLFKEEIDAGAQLHPILGMESPFQYRNKVTTPFAPGKRGPNGGREILYGMYELGTHHIIPKSSCLIENEQAQEIINALPPLMKRYRVMPYDEDHRRGFLRHAIVRVGHQSGEILLTLVTNGEQFPGSKSFCRDLVRRCPQITSIVQNINTAHTNTILGQKERRLYGPGFILDQLCGLSFRISSRSFYQVNASQTAKLYEQAIALAQLSGKESVIDAYCGTGTIGLVAASRGAAKVIGVDSIDEAIRDGRENARHNGIENAQFVTADATEFMAEMAESEYDVDVVFLDPPRCGCSEPFLQSLLRLGPQRVVYISCNPKTQVNDLRILSSQGYKTTIIMPVDMFPHTDHIESIAVAEQMEG